jgi:hypothetical protein
MVIINNYKVNETMEENILYLFRENRIADALNLAYEVELKIESNDEEKGLANNITELLREGRISDALDLAVEYYKVKLKIKSDKKEKEVVNNIINPNKFFLTACY